VAIIKLPYVAWRNGRPRFNPGPRERELGFAGEDLRHRDRPGAPWYTLEEAKAWADANAEKIADARAGVKVKPVRKSGNTMRDLLEDWLAALEKSNAAPATLASYRKAVRAVLWKPETRAAARVRRVKERAAAELELEPPVKRTPEKFAAAIPAAIGAPELRAFYDYAKEARGWHMALSMIAAISAAWTWGRESTKWRLGPNPRHTMEFDRPDGRVVLIALEEFIQIVRAADHLGRPSIGDSFYLGLFGGRRQTDRLLLEDGGLVDGRRALRQSKTGKLIPCRDTPQLAARLEAARARVAAIKLKLGTRPATIVVDESTGLPYNDTTYRHWFAEVRRVAVAGVPGVLAPMPSCAEKRDQDLRDTCVILLYRAGATELEICDITGHSYRSVQLIKEHYLGSNNLERADAAIDRLAAFVTAQCEAV